MNTLLVRSLSGKVCYMFHAVHTLPCLANCISTKCCFYRSFSYYKLFIMTDLSYMAVNYLVDNNLVINEDNLTCCCIIVWLVSFCLPRLSHVEISLCRAEQCGSLPRLINTLALLISMELLYCPFQGIIFFNCCKDNQNYLASYIYQLLNCCLSRWPLCRAGSSCWGGHHRKWNSCKTHRLTVDKSWYKDLISCFIHCLCTQSSKVDYTGAIWWLGQSKVI